MADTPLTPSTGSLLLSRASYVVTPLAGALVVAGLLAGVSGGPVNRNLAPNAGLLQLSRGSPVLTPLAATLSATGLTPSVGSTTSTTILSPTTGALALSPKSLTLDLGITPSARVPIPPATRLNTAYVTPGGATITVGPTDSLQAAITSANPGDLIVVDVANVSPPINLPSKGGSSVIYIISSALASLPEGTRVGPSQAVLMPKITSTDTTPAITTDAGAHHYRFAGFEISTTYALQAGTNFVVVDLEAPFPGNQTLADQPHHITFDRCYVHGTPTGNNRRGFLLNGATLAVVDSYVSDFHEIGADSQAIAVWNGAGPFKILNNYLEAAGENFLSGGVDPHIAGLVPSDLEFRNNYCFKPLSWDVNDASYAGNRWAIKNLFELKNAQRLLVDGNTFDRKWGQDGGQLHAIAFTPRNQDGTAPWSIVSDVTFTNNVITHVNGGLALQGTDNNFPSQVTRRILVSNNVWDINGTAWGGRGDWVFVTDYGSDYTFDHNTAFHVGDPGVVAAPILFTTINGVTLVGLVKIERFVFTNNICNYDSFGIFGDLGAGNNNDAIAAYTNGGVVTGNVVVAGSAANFPAGNFFPADLTAVGFQDLNQFPDVRLAPTSAFVNAALDGLDIGKLLAPPNPPSSQTLSLRGFAPALVIAGPRLTPNTGAVNFSGQTPTVVTAGAKITPGTGALTITGTASTYVIQAIPGTASLALTGQAPTLAISQPTISPVTASLGLTASPPILRIGQSALPSPGSLALVGQTLTVVSGVQGSVSVTPSTGTLRLTRGDVGLTPTAAALALNGLQPVVVSPPAQGLTPGTGSLFFGDFVGQIPTTGTLALTGAQPGLGISVTPLTATLALSGQPAAVVPTTAIRPATGALTVTPNQAAVLIATLMTPATGSLTLVGQQAGTGIVTTPDTGSLTLTGGTPVVALVSMTPGTGTLTLTGGTASSPGLSFTMTPLTGALTLNGQVVLPSLGFILQPVSQRPMPNYIRRLRILGVR